MDDEISREIFTAAAARELGPSAKLVRFTLTAPAIITSRLMCGVRVGDATLSIEYGGGTSDGRRAYRYYIDLPDGTEYTNDDLASGVGGGSLQFGLESLVGFLAACGESWNYDHDGERGENADLFPANVAEWAGQNSDELSCLSSELEETHDAITEGGAA
jgi:hypothetical protein